MPIFFCSICFWDSSMFLYVLVVYSFLWLSSILLCGCTSVYLFFFLFMIKTLSKVPEQENFNLIKKYLWKIFNCHSFASLCWPLGCRFPSSLCPHLNHHRLCKRFRWTSAKVTWNRLELVTFCYNKVVKHNLKISVAYNNNYSYLPHVVC